MFEGLLEKSVAYEGELQLAADEVISEFDMDRWLLTSEMRKFLKDKAKEHQVSEKDLKARIKELLDD